MPRRAQGNRYRRQYEEHIRALEIVLRLLDDLLEHAAPLGLSEDRFEVLTWRREYLRETKVVLSIVLHLLQKVSKEELAA